MEASIQARTVCQITRDILVNGNLCFRQGDRVVVEQLAEELADYPGAVYVVRSPTTGSQYRLREADLTLAEPTIQTSADTNIGKITRAIVIDGVQVLGEGQSIEIINVSSDSSGATTNVLVRGNDGREYRVQPEAVSLPQGLNAVSTPQHGSTDCIHKFSKSSDGRVVCSKCGAAAPYRRPPEESFAPMVKCPKCGNSLGEIDLFCRKCREPNIPLIKKRAYDQNISKERCRHRFARFIDGRVCTTCGLVKYLGPTVIRRDSEGNITSIACSKCGTLLHEEDDYCPACSQRLKSALVGSTPQPPARATGLGECPFCGAKNPVSSVFCEICGREMLDQGSGIGTTRTSSGNAYQRTPSRLKAERQSDDYRADRLMLANGIVELVAGATYLIIMLVVYVQWMHSANSNSDSVPGAVHYLFLSFLAVGVIIVILGILAIKSPARYYGLHVALAAISVFFGNIFFIGVINIKSSSYTNETWIAVLLTLALLGGGITVLILTQLAENARSASLVEFA